MSFVLRMMVEVCHNLTDLQEERAYLQLLNESRPFFPALSSSPHFTATPNIAESTESLGVRATQRSPHRAVA